MEYQDSLQEEEEFIVLDPDHVCSFFFKNIYALSMNKCCLTALQKKSFLSVCPIY